MKPISRDRFRPPRAALAGLLLAALFTLASPRRALAELAHPVVEQRLADVQAFVTTWYGPSSATLILTGKVEPAAAVALARSLGGVSTALREEVRDGAGAD